MQCVDIFEAAIKSATTLRSYRYWFNRFLETSDIRTAEALLALGKEDPSKLTEIIIRKLGEQKKRVENHEISSSTVISLYSPMKLFCVMNDIMLNWDKIAKTLPSNNSVGRDRPIEINEIRQLLKYADLRTRAIILLMASSGIRVGAIPDLKAGDIEPITEDNKILAAKIMVYRGTDDQYLSFMTPEAWESISEYLDFRRRHGEQIDNDSPLFRNKFNKNASEPWPIERDAIRVLLTRAMRNAGLRKERKKRYDFKTDHGFRKFFKTRAEQAMKSIHVEMLMGHATGVSKHYYKPSEREILQDYLNAVPLLTIEQAQSLEPKLSSELEELKQKEEQRENEISDLKNELSDYKLLKSLELIYYRSSINQVDDNKFFSQKHIVEWINANLPRIRASYEKHEEKRQYIYKMNNVKPRSFEELISDPESINVVLQGAYEELLFTAPEQIEDISTKIAEKFKQDLESIRARRGVREREED